MRNLKKLCSLFLVFALLCSVLAVSASAAAGTITVDTAITGGSVTVSSAEAEEGSAVTVTVTPDEGNVLNPATLTYTYTADGVKTIARITQKEGVYTFTMPASDVTVSAVFVKAADFKVGDPNATVWDGVTVDVSWYNTTDKEFHIKTPAQLAGLAAIVNGLVNSDITTIVGDDDGTKIKAYFFKDPSTYGGQQDGWRGTDEFLNKVIYLDTDLDMGGKYDAATGTWSGARFMPISGKCRLDPDDADTQLNANFTGSIDGQGHWVNNIYAYLTNTNWAADVGFIGMWGLGDGEANEIDRKPTYAFIRNLIIGPGYIDADRSVGGIVGKAGKNGNQAGEWNNNGDLTIENCANYATIVGHQKKGTGGIIGASWNGIKLVNCYNAGSVTNGNDQGGVSGNAEGPMTNCFNVGMVNGGSGSSLTYSNGGDTYINCYWLEGTGSKAGTTSTGATMVTSEYMKSAEFLAALNGDGRAFVADDPENPKNNGYPVLRVSVPDSSVCESIVFEGEPELNYIEGQTFDPTGLTAKAEYSDGTSETINQRDFVLSVAGALTPEVTEITVTVTLGDKSASKTYAISVVEAPKADANGVYTLDSASDMDWLLWQVNDGVNPTVSVKLGCDLDLSDEEWTPIGTNKFPFKGTFDGDGHSITIKISNVTSTSSYQGLFGFAQDATFRNVTVKGTVNAANTMGTTSGNMGGLCGYSAASNYFNCKNEATVIGSINVGGIAGTANSAIISGCVNTGDITAERQAGGIVGYGGGSISDCYNAGAITVTGAGNSWQTQGAGGITSYFTTSSRTNPIAITRCYNSGVISAANAETLLKNGAILAYDSSNQWGFITVADCYYLAVDGLSGVGNTTEYGKVETTAKTADELKALTATLNGNGEYRAFVDSETINNGYPALRWQTADTSTLERVEVDAATKDEYISGTKITADDIVIYAYYSDGTKTRINNFNCADLVWSKTNEFLVADNGSKITLTFTWEGTPYTMDYTVSVVPYKVSSIEVTTQPSLTMYAAGDAFNTTGMKVTATYTNGKTANVTDYVVAPSGALSTGNTSVTVWYSLTDGDETAYSFAQSEPVAITVINPLQKDGEVYLISNETEMLWFAAQVNSGVNLTIQGKLTKDLDFSEATYTPVGNNTKQYSGTFDGNGHTVKLNIDATTGYQALFGYVYNATVKNVTVTGSVKSTGSYTAGIVGYANGTTVIENCVNQATVSGAGYTAGIVSRANAVNVSIVNCANTGAVTGANFVGGITSYSKAAISGSYNTGDITGSYDVAGIAGYNYAGNITDCYNTGAITATAGSATYGVGGIVGRQNTVVTTISSVYNTGTVTGSNGTIKVGAIIGYLNKNVTLTNVYALQGSAENAIGGQNSSVTVTGEVVFKTADELKAADLVTALNNGTTAWKADGTCVAVNNGYPVLARTATVDHTVEVLPGKDATCTETGLTEGSKCSACGEILVAQTEIPALGHTPQTVPGKDATCTEPGLGVGSKCSVCGETITSQDEIANKGHSPEVVPGKDATCTETGLTEGSKCSACGEILVAQTEIPALGHTPETVPGKDATCTEPGLGVGSKCTICGETITSQDEIANKGHSPEVIPGKDATCTEPGLTEGSKCSACGEILVAQTEIPTKDHSWGDWAKQNDGSYSRECAVCGTEDSMTIDAETPVNTTPENNAAESTLNNTDAELIDMILTNEDLSEMASGADVSIYLVVDDVSKTVSKEEKDAVKALAGDDTIGMYLDINLFKQIDDTKTQVTQTSGPMTITITIPDKLINTKESVTRTYKIIRVHEDTDGSLVTDILDGNFNAADKSFTFKTDKFSTYALTYNDVDANIPQTGDSNLSVLWISLMVLAFAGLGGLWIYRKKSQAE